MNIKLKTQSNRFFFSPVKLRSSIKANRPLFLTVTIILAISTAFGAAFPVLKFENGRVSMGKTSFIRTGSANSTYVNITSSSISLNITPSTTNMISSNDNWTGITGVEGYYGQNLTGTHGVDPQTVLGTEFTSNALPMAGQTQVNANKGNPSAFNAGGVSEFDSGDYLAIGFQGNVQANPYLVFYLNTTGVPNVIITYTVKDIDVGSNNSVSPLALQYRVGETGLFTNIPEGYIADATDGPNAAGRVTTKTVALPAICGNQPKVQVRLITTNAASPDGSSTPDEWLGINNIIVSSFSPTAASASVSGRVTTESGKPISRAIVTMVDSAGATRTANSNNFGYYRFEGVPVGNVYFFSIRGKGYIFPTQAQTLYVSDNYDALNFVANDYNYQQNTRAEQKTKLLF